MVLYLQKFKILNKTNSRFFFLISCTYNRRYISQLPQWFFFKNAILNQYLESSSIHLSFGLHCLFVNFSLKFIYMKARQKNSGKKKTTPHIQKTATNKRQTRPNKTPNRLKALKTESDHSQVHQFPVTRISDTLR